MDSSPEEYIDYVNNKDGYALCFEEDAEFIKIPHIDFGKRYDSSLQAKKLFAALREIDERKIKQKVYARIPSKNGVGLAVYNRLIRAAGFKVINPQSHYVIGLTGGSGSGKTVISKELEKAGCAVIDCDKITRHSSVYDDECVKELAEAFGDDIVNGGELNRKLLAERAFASSEGKKELNRITHPRIMKKVMHEYNSLVSRGEEIIVFDAPTLFEAGLDSKCSRIISVTAPKSIRIARIMKRDNISFEAAERRISAQNDDEYFIKRSDHIIINDDSINIHTKRIEAIVNGLKNKLRLYRQRN